MKKPDTPQKNLNDRRTHYGIFERAIRRGVRDGVSNAVSKALQPTVNRIADQATTAAQQYAECALKPRTTAHPFRLI